MKLNQLKTGPDLRMDKIAILAITKTGGTLVRASYPKGRNRYVLCCDGHARRAAEEIEQHGIAVEQNGMYLFLYGK